MSVFMDSGGNFHICLEFKEHVTTKFPILTGDHHGFVHIRHYNLKKLLAINKHGLTCRVSGQRGPGGNSRAQDWASNQSNTPSTRQSETDFHTVPLPMNEKRGEVRENFGKLKAGNYRTAFDPRRENQKIVQSWSKTNYRKGNGW